jgi:hypothetical protein
MKPSNVTTLGPFAWPLPIILREVNYKCSRQEKKIYQKYYLSDEERRQVLKDIGDAACLVLEYYLRRAGRDDGDIHDWIVARHLGWKQQKVKRQRLALTRNGWIQSVKYTSAKGRKAITHYIGKQAVRESYMT